MKNFNVRIITPNYTANVDELTSMTLKTIVGEMTILPNHYPLISSIEMTKIVFRRDKSIITAFASEGMINIREKEVVLILNAFEFKDDIDLERARASYQRAYERINSKEESIDVARAEAALRRAMMRISIVEGN